MVVVAIGFIATLGIADEGAGGFLHAALEAGLVGGLADWFAVVALFRHPLGVPIPHTAVIPRSKAGLGQNLASFVRDNFLQAEQVEQRLADPAHLDRLAAWLRDEGNADRTARRLAGIAGDALDGADEDAVVDRVAQEVRSRFDQLALARLAGEALEEAIEERRHQDLVDAAVEGLRAAVIRNRGPLRRRLGQESPSWVPPFLDDLVFDRADEVVRRFLGQVADNREHDVRRIIDEQLVVLATKLQTDPRLAERVQQAAADVIDDEDLRGWIRSLWEELRTGLAQAASDDPDGGQVRVFAIASITDLGRRLAEDEALRGRILDVLRSASPRIAETGQAEVAGIIASTIDRWDVEETSQRLETWMGPDLQFVRINGTVVGALVGLVLHGVGKVVG